jgi:hypothetical protein
MPSEPVRSEDVMYPPVPDSVLPHYSEAELRELLAKAGAEVEADPLTLGAVTAHLCSLIKRRTASRSPRRSGTAARGAFDWGSMGSKVPPR